MKTRYLELIIPEKHKTVVIIKWLPSTKDMANEEFKESLRTFIAFMKEQGNIKSILVDTKEKEFTMGIEIQEWHDREIIPEYEALEIKKIAFLMSEHVIALMSIEQTFEEEAAEKAMEMRFFAEKEEALMWLEE